MRRRPMSQNGFTLLEVLVAVVILGLAYVTLLESFSLSSRNIHRLGVRRQKLHARAMAFDRQLEAAAAGEGELFLAGHRFNLRLLTSEDGRLATLRLGTE